MKTLIDKKVGEYYRVPKGELVPGTAAIAVSLADADVNPGESYQFTFWNRPLKYVGQLLKNGDRLPDMLFHIGDDEQYSYYEIVSLVTCTRVYKTYKLNGSGRDYNFRKGAWK